MSYKDKAATGGGDSGYRGGRVDDDQPKPKPVFRCFASQCPMPGTLFPAGSKEGVCAYHYGANPSDWPRITQTLLDWQCVTYEVNEARRALTGEIAADPVALEEAFRNAWERLEPLSGEWTDRLRPGNILWKRDGALVDSGMRESYSDWAKRLHAFVGSRVQEVLTVRHRRAA